MFEIGSTNFVPPNDPYVTTCLLYTSDKTAQMLNVADAASLEATVRGTMVSDSKNE